MKNVVLFVSFVLATSLFQDAESKRMTFAEIKEVLQPVKDICIERVKIDPKLIDNANNGNFVPDRKLQCYYKCMMVMAKISNVIRRRNSTALKHMTKDDQLNEITFVRVVETMIEEQYVEPVLNGVLHCQPITTKGITDGCVLAYELIKCIYEYNPALMLFP